MAIPVIITGQRSNGGSFSEQTKTQVVNAHGASVLLHERVVPGQKLCIRNLATDEEVSCTVKDVNTGSSETPEVGVAFSQPSPRFWRVSFPPEDWSLRSSEAKRVSVAEGQAKPKPVVSNK